MIRSTMRVVVVVFLLSWEIVNVAIPQTLRRLEPLPHRERSSVAGKDSISKKLAASSDASYILSSAQCGSRLLTITKGKDATETYLMERPNDVRIIVQFRNLPLSRVSPMGKGLSVLKVQSALMTLRTEHAQFKSDLAMIEGSVGSFNETKISAEYQIAFNGMAITTTRSVLKEIQQLSYVSGVWLDDTVKALDDTSNTVIGAPTVWNNFNVHGEGIDIGIIDSGIDYLHPALGGAPFPNSKVVGGYDFCRNVPDPMDCLGHGTHVAGIAAGDCDSLHGVAYKARLWAFRVLDCLGSGTWSMVIAGIDRALDPDNDPATPTPISVINLSLGGVGSPGDPICQAVNNAVSSGIVCVVAAGNSGPDPQTILSPAIARRALTVGASNNSDVIASFSSRGSEWYTLGEKSGIKPDVVAPGVNIRSAVPSGYSVFSGTSLAAPHVAGAAALLRQLHPDWTADQIKAVLMESAHDIGQGVWTQGSGRVSLPDAMSDSVIIEPPSIHFGVDDVTQAIWTTTTTLKFTNTSSNARTFNLGLVMGDSLSGLPGFSLTFNPAQVTVSSGGTASVSVRLSLDNRVFPYSSSPEAFTGKIIAASTSQLRTFTLPFTFLKFHFIKFIADETPLFLFAVNRTDGEFSTGYYFGQSILNDTINFVPRNTSDTVDVFGSFWDEKTWIVKLNIAMNGIPTVYLRKADSKNMVTQRRLDRSGTLISELANFQAWTEEFVIRDRTRFIMDCFKFDGWCYASEPDTLYLPDLDSTCYVNLLSQVVHEGNFYVFPFTIEKGLTSSLTLENDPAKFKRIDYTYKALNVSYVRAVSEINGTGYTNGLVSPEIFSSPFERTAYYMPPTARYNLSFTHTKVDYPSAGNRIRMADMKFAGPDTLRFHTWTYDGDSQYVSSVANPLKVKLGYGIPMWTGIAHNQPGQVYVLSPLWTRLSPATVLFVHPLWQEQHGKPTCKLFSGSTIVDSAVVLSPTAFGFWVVAGSYAVEVYDTGYKIVDSAGKATARLEFDTRRGDPNPPGISNLLLVTNGNISDEYLPDDTTTIDIDATDDTAIDSAMVYFRQLGDVKWTQGTIIHQAGSNRYHVGELPELGSDYISMRLRMVDQAGNALDYRMEPAFFYRSVPAIPRFVSPLDNDSGRPTFETLRWSRASNTLHGSVTYQLQLSTDSLFTTCMIDEDSLREPCYRLRNLEKGTTYYWHVSAKNIIGKSPYSKTWSFTTSGDTTFILPFSKHWNLMSIPVHLTKNVKENIFPTAISNAFSYVSQQYQANDTFKSGCGYWMKFEKNDTIGIAGVPFNADTIDVEPGWNMIGSISTPISVDGITSEPSGMVTSYFWGYSTSYNLVDSLKPGYGYWVKVEQPGKLILSRSECLLKLKRIRIVATAEMPPPPPGEQIQVVKEIPREYSLEQNYPNPFNSVTDIRYQILDISHVMLKVYDILGREVATLVNEIQDAGFKSVKWDANELSSGIYFYSLTITSDKDLAFHSVKKLILMK